MASIGKVAASFLSANNENTVALASINFDFSLWKIEAPKEFHSISDSLTSQRREEAEGGTLHQTARRLGSLFHDVIPQTPALLHAYGQRASEISKLVNSSPDERSKGFGPFKDHLGLDASTIWAGATSGNSAIAIHLLACMLARTWKGPEAISIWSEIVVERKREIERQCLAGDTFPIGTIMAAKQELRREDLAKWDASARAWLRSADRMKQKEQTQLLLIVKNVDIAVSNAASTYPNVLAAWKTAMSGLESILKGVPQRVQNGAVLLGLIAWHIFPDIVVLGQKVTEVRFGDNIVPAAGILEIGLSKASQENSRGVFWSLSLAHLRYYGAPVSVSRSATYDESRVSFDQLYIIALGSIMTKWDIEMTKQSFTEVFRFMRVLGEKLGSSKGELFGEWLHGLIAAASAIKSTKGLDGKYASLLFSYGRHQGKSLIEKTPTLFGLNNYSTLLRLTDDEEGRIAILRRIASALHIPEHLCIIRYSHRFLGCDKLSYEYASSKEYPQSQKRNQLGDRVGFQGASRWIEMDPDWIETNSKPCENDSDSYLNSFSNTEGKGWNNFTKRRSEIAANSEECYKLPLYKIEQKYPAQSISSERTTHTGEIPKEAVYLWARQEKRSSHSNKASQNWIDSIQHQIFYLVFGNAKDGGLFIASEMLERRNLTDFLNTISAINDNDYHKIIENISTKELKSYFSNVDEWMKLRPLTSLEALSAAASLFQPYPDAKFPLQICSQPLGKASWIPLMKKGETLSQQRKFLTRMEKFSCLAYFETGTCDIAPDSLEFVMALSTGDTLYISECLLSDPAAEHDHSAIQRAMGNVGRPGVSMLLSPGTVQMRSQRIDSWMLVDPMPFDGTRQDSFSATSMHLSFTGYELPIGNAPTGGRDVEAALVETVVSILDSGEWVADLDVVSRNSPTGSCIFSDGLSGFHVFKNYLNAKDMGIKWSVVIPMQSQTCYLFTQLTPGMDCWPIWILLVLFEHIKIGSLALLPPQSIFSRTVMFMYYLIIVVSNA